MDAKLRSDLVTIVHHHYIGQSPSVVKAGKCVDKVLAKIMEHYEEVAREEHLEKLAERAPPPREDDTSSFGAHNYPGWSDKSGECEGGIHCPCCEGGDICCRCKEIVS
jgi:hypothetical protein